MEAWKMGEESSVQRTLVTITPLVCGRCTHTKTCRNLNKCKKTSLGRARVASVVCLGSNPSGMILIKGASLNFAMAHAGNRNKEQVKTTDFIYTFSVNKFIFKYRVHNKNFLVV
jgi:hypothetical protein